MVLGSVYNIIFKKECFLSAKLSSVECSSKILDTTDFLLGFLRTKKTTLGLSIAPIYSW